MESLQYSHGIMESLIENHWKSKKNHHHGESTVYIYIIENPQKIHHFFGIFGGFWGAWNAGTLEAQRVLELGKRDLGGLKRCWCSIIMAWRNGMIIYPITITLKRVSGYFWHFGLFYPVNNLIPIGSMYGIYANMTGGLLMGSMLPYLAAYMDPSWVMAWRNGMIIYDHGIIFWHEKKHWNSGEVCPERVGIWWNLAEFDHFIT